MSSLSLCLIVKPTPEEAGLLDRLLVNIPKGTFEELCITITGESKEVEDVARSHGAKISYFTWTKDFSAARNFNFSQATSDYIMWVDADDLINGVENIQKLKEHLGGVVDGVVMDYLYDFDSDGVCTVKHLKTRIVKNDGCVSWVGALHEDFSPNRQLLVEKSEDVAIAHHTNDERVKQNFERNTEIAKEELLRKSDDPRSYWLVANALLSESKHKEALPYYLDFVSRSKSEDEMYLAFIRMGDIYDILGDQERAYFSIFQAFLLRPWYPDAYFQLGKMYFRQGKLRAAETVILDGLRKPIPKDEIIVYNPRDYDVNPLNLLSRVYFAQNKPREARMCMEKIYKVYPKKDIRDVISAMKTEEEKLNKITELVDGVKKSKSIDEARKLIDSVPQELQAHPGVCAIRNQFFKKTESSGRDISIYCGYTSEEWTPESIKKTGIGGSEEAVINLSKGLVARGWNVTVYNSCGFRESTHDGVVYRPFWMFNVEDKQDVVIIWRHPKMLDFNINAKTIILDLHDVVPAGEFTISRVNKLSRIMVKSMAQRVLFPNIPDEKFSIVPNGIDVSLFEQDVKRDPYLIVNFSSPDRGLYGALKIFERVLKKLPKDIAKKTRFEWYYGFGVFDSIYAEDPEAQKWKDMVMKKFKSLPASGGYRISHAEVAKKNLQAGALLYPTEFYEIDYIGGSKAQAGGCVPITSDFGSLHEKIQFGVKIHSSKTKDNWTDGVVFDHSVDDERYVNALIDYLKNPELWEGERKKMMEWARKTFSWDVIVDSWNKILSA